MAPQQRSIVYVANDGTLTPVGTATPLPVTGGGGGGGSGDASAANQVLANTKLDTLATDIGAPADAAASADTGTFSLIAIAKRIVAKLTSIITKQPAFGTAGTASVDVLTVQGIASGTAQPVSGTFWQATQPVGIALPTTIYNNVKNVTTAGTRVTLAASQAILSGVTIKAKAANTGTIYVGDSSVSSTTGYALAPGDSVFLEIANLNTVNIDSSVNGEGVTYCAS